MRRLSLCMLVFVGLAGWCLPALGASFDCAKAVTPREKAVCASPALSAADEQLAAAYKAVLEQLPADGAAVARADQREWLKSLDERCPSGDHGFADCLKGAYSDRVDALKKAVLRMGGVTFYWRSVHLTQPDNAEDAADDKQRGAPPYGTLDVAWPQAARDTPEWRAWNKAMEAEVRDLAAAQGGEHGTSTEWRKKWATDQDIDISVVLDAVTDRLATASVVDSFYGHGAAHPNTAYLEFNWLLKEQRELKAEDVFRADSGWKQALYDKTDRYLHQALDDEQGGSYQNWGAAGQVAKTVHGLVEDSRNWQMDAKGITILFDPYAVACYACTPEPFTIPWADLGPLLKEGFAAPR